MMIGAKVDTYMLEPIRPRQVARRTYVWVNAEGGNSRSDHNLLRSGPLHGLQTRFFHNKPQTLEKNIIKIKILVMHTDYFAFSTR